MDKIEIESTLQDMEAFINEASRVPLTGKVMLDGDYLLECIDKLHALMPEEIKQAKQVLEQSDKLLDSIKLQGQGILENARKEAEKMVEESEVVKQSHARAEAVEKAARENAMNMSRDVREYADNVLHQLEVNLEKALFTIKKSREEMQSQTSALEQM